MYKQFLKLISLQVILLVLSKCHSVDSKCSITPGDRNLTKYPTAVIVVLNCTFNGRSVDTVSWKRNKQPFENNTLVDSAKRKKWSAVVLYTNSTTIQDVGEFTCVANRGKDVYSCSVQPSKPKLRKLPSVVIAVVDSTPKLVCQTSGWPVPHLSWWRKGAEIRDGDHLNSYMIKRDDKGLMMKIMTIAAFHHGTYFCRADNIFGTSEEYVNIMVKRVHVMIKNNYLDKQGNVAVEGRNTTLECICVQKECKEKTASTYWKNNGSDVSASRKFKLSKQVLTTGVKIMMTILNVSLTDQGMYYCGINTSKGFAEVLRPLRIISNVNAPRISPTSNESARRGSPTWLKCNAIYPVILTTPTTFWLFNNTRLAKESQHYLSKDHGPRLGPNSTKLLTLRLHISNVSAKHVGWYTCGVDFKIDVVTADVYFSLQEETPGEEADDPNIDSSSEDSPLVAISSITAGGLIMGFVAAFVAYRLCRNRRDAEEPFFETPVNGRQFRYDVFVTFSSQDLNWVNKELLPLLEKHKLIYCIHDRDFEIGKAVVDNMAESVYTSRKVLAVMSHNYMSSKFCRGELEMALYRSTEMGDSSVIVMRIDGVDRSKLPKALRNRTFLDHYDITERKTWEERLIKHLKPPQIDKSAEKKSLEKCYTLLNATEV